MLFCLLILASGRRHSRRRPETAVNDIFGDGVFEDTRDDPSRKKEEWREIVSRIDPTEQGQTDLDHYDIEDELYKPPKKPEIKEDEFAATLRRMKAKKKLENMMKRYFVKHIREDLRQLSDKVHAKVRVQRMRDFAEGLK